MCVCVKVRGRGRGRGGVIFVSQGFHSCVFLESTTFRGLDGCLVDDWKAKYVWYILVWYALNSLQIIMPFQRSNNGYIG